MLTKNKCDGCQFFKIHSLFTERGVDKVGATCEITNKDTKLVLGNEIIDFDLQQQCPLRKISKYEQLKLKWAKFIEFIADIEQKSENLVYEAKKLLTDITNKIRELEKGE